MLKQVKLNKADSDLIQLCEVNRTIERRAILIAIINGANPLANDASALKSLVLNSEFKLIREILHLSDVECKIATTNLSELVRFHTKYVQEGNRDAFETLILIKTLGGFDNIPQRDHNKLNVKLDADIALNQVFRANREKELRDLTAKIVLVDEEKKLLESKAAASTKELERLKKELEELSKLR